MQSAQNGFQALSSKSIPDYAYGRAGVMVGHHGTKYSLQSTNEYRSIKHEQLHNVIVTFTDDIRHHSKIITERSLPSSPVSIPSLTFGLLHLQYCCLIVLSCLDCHNL